jgi:hypothetical protein
MFFLESRTVFSLPRIAAVQGHERLHEGAAIVFNECLLRLMHMRKQRIEAGGNDERSTLVWKLAEFQQSILYRIVMLAQGASSSWNDGNLLSSVLCSRALLETVASMHHLVVSVVEHTQKSEADLKAITQLVKEQLYATRNRDWLSDQAGFRADLAKKIKALDAAMPGIKEHYAFLSDICHPNFLGQRFLFAGSDTDKKATTLSESLNRNSHMLDAIFGCVMMINNFEKMFDELSKVVDLLCRPQKAT